MAAKRAKETLRAEALTVSDPVVVEMFFLPTGDEAPKGDKSVD
jgi:hypothetical protein